MDHTHSNIQMHTIHAHTHLAALTRHKKLHDQLHTADTESRVREAGEHSFLKCSKTRLNADIFRMFNHDFVFFYATNLEELR